MIRKLLIVPVGILILWIIYTLFNPKIDQYKGRTVHLSIDDVEVSMRNLSKHNYGSIFDEPFFAYLQQLHKDYGIKISLYIYKEADNYDIKNFPAKYKREFANNADWLKFGFHAIRPHFNEEITANLDTFLTAYRQVDSCITVFAGESSKSQILRLHYFFATPEERTLISRMGGAILLTADNPGRRSYSLSDNQLNALRKGSYNDNELHYLATDLRIENMTIPDYNLRAHQENDTLVIFTHEWALKSRTNRLKLTRTLQILENNKVNYIN